MLSSPLGAPVGDTAYFATKRKPNPISAAAAFVLPSATKCVSGAKLTIRIRKLSHVRWLRATVKVNGKHFKSIKRSQITKPVKLTGLPTRKFVLSIIARASDGRSATASRRYKACATKTVKPSSISPGSYSGGVISFYVSADGKQVQDATTSPYGASLSCTPGGSFADDTFDISSIAIAADGSFSGTATQTGVEDNSTAMFTYTFSGHFQGTTATGTWREDVTYNNGTAHSCTSNSKSWSATRDAQGTQTASSPPAGSYSGGVISFYVSADGKQVQDATTSPYGASLSCTPGGSFGDDTFSIPSIAIAADGSFSGTATQSGVVDSSPATFTYTFSGHFHGTNTSGVERAAGTWREDVTYNNGATHTCTSNTNPWSATRDAQGTQTASSPPPGSYSGGVISFHVSADGKQVQDATTSPYGASLSCTPGGSFGDDTFSIPSIAIAADGSFSGTATQSGVVDSSPATFTYTFSGHFHGTNTSGDERAAGTWREDVTYNNGTAYSCTSDTNPWSATG